MSTVPGRTGGQSSLPRLDDASEGDADHAYAEDVVKRAGTSFYWAMRLQPEAKRKAMFAIYAFCREVDDIADGPNAAAAKLARLAEWQADIDRLFEGRPRQTITRALMEPISTFGLRKRDFEAILRGMEMDAADRVRIADREELRLYCDRVACAVGRLSVRVFGVAGETGVRLAHAQGQALQLTNILRDLAEDAERDRLYLPADELRRAGIAEVNDTAAVLRHPRLAGVCEGLAETATLCFAEAGALIAGCDNRDVRPAAVMMEVYRRTFARLMARGWQRWSEPVSLSKAEKLWVALRYGIL